MLDQQVKAGDLPPVAERLPDKPMVIEPTGQMGIYGGTWQAWAAREFVDPYRMAGYDPLVRWDPDFIEPIPNLAESWEIGQEGREYTFHLRKGVKWSDGVEFTAEDIVFAYNDVMMNEEIFPILSPYFNVGGKPATLEQLDEYTVRFVFAEPTGLFLGRLASANVDLLTATPRHYFEQFHAKYNQDADQLAKQDGLDRWADLFAAKGGIGPWALEFWQPDIPTLFAWRTTEPLETGGRLVVERNPYYWKVDPEGSQLPYLDRIVVTVTSGAETGLLNATNGEYNFVPPTFFGGFCTAGNKPVIARNREDGGYRFVDGRPSTMNEMVISLNLTHEDAKMREVFRNKDFRIGLSHAINRDEIIDAVYQRQGEPWQAAPRKESQFFDEELAKQYTTYDVTKAEEYLDKAGYEKRDGQGFRLRPDGERISFVVEASTERPTDSSSLELIRDYWAAIGVDMQIKTESRDLLVNRLIANTYDAMVWTGDGGGSWEAVFDPRYYFPWFGWAMYAPRWAAWYESGGAEGETPPAPLRTQMELYDELKQTVGPEEQKELFMQILEIAREQFYAIGTVLPTSTYGLVAENFHNVPELMWASSLYVSPGSTRPEQYFVTEGADS